jgi:DNA-binding GntR family transcriptional regulator
MDFNLHKPLDTQYLLRAQVYEYLREELKSKRMEPGKFISMNQVMKELEISRTPLRDALLQLQAEGFVTFYPQRGILINKLSEKDIYDMYEMLGALDSTLFLRVFDQIGDREINRMKEINEEMISTVKNEQLNLYFSLNTQFHNEYLKLSTNKYALDQINILRQRLFDFGKQGDWIDSIRKLNYDEHIILIGHLEKGNVKKATEFIRDVHCAVTWK